MYKNHISQHIFYIILQFEVMDIFDLDSIFR